MGDRKAITRISPPASGPQARTAPKSGADRPRWLLRRMAPYWWPTTQAEQSGAFPTRGADRSRISIWHDRAYEHIILRQLSFLQRGYPETDGGASCHPCFAIQALTFTSSIPAPD